ncbi:zinc-ribbon domain-containing protein [Microbacterium sp. NPDC089696]|uniref:zinc-ribbon domain-containing protein n=1 Tax=Microbacterium sp. NPDC089696 TaxID=3364199 RepID=UPI0037FD64E9
MLRDAVVSLPERIRPVAHETPASFERRLSVANGYTERAWNVAINDALRAAAPADRVSVLEMFGGLRPGHFAREERRGGTFEVIGQRYACVLCAHGEHAEQTSHDGPRVCGQHMRWTGPDTSPDDQYPVDVDVLRADRAYRRLRKAGFIDAARLSELLACVDAWTAAAVRPMDPAQRFYVAVALAQSLPKVWATPVVEDRYALLVALVERTVDCRSSAVLVDALWLLLRAERYAGLIVGSDGKMAGHEDLHTHLTTSFYPRTRHLQVTQMVRPDGIGDRFTHAERWDRENDYVCVAGHPFTSTGRRLRASKASGGCGICARKKASPDTSLAATHELLCSEWDHEKNGDISPEDVLAGSGVKRFWVCAAMGHSFEVSPNARTTSGVGCGYCANLLVDETNSLRATHPDIAAEVNEALSGGRTADNVVAGSEYTMTFTCSLGHDYETTPANRTRGSQCLVCAHQVVHLSTCLATVAPDVAAMWHETLNGDLTPWDVFPGSMAKAWWKCPNGCDYDGAIVKRVEGVGCRYCSNRAVSERNCMRVTRPDLAAEFHPWKNNERTPDNVVAGTAHKLWWLCIPHGHDWEVSGGNRVRQGTGCPYCSGKKVWVGFNDMATTRPDMAADFSRTRNGDLTPQNVVAGTGKRLWWECQTCGHEWPSTGDSRANSKRGCKECARRKKSM